MISYDEANRLFYIDYERGVLIRKISTAPRARAGDIVGNANTSGALQVKVHGKCILVHHIVWLLHHGEWPSRDIDHRNGLSTDNRPDNLRLCDQVGNCQNRSVHRNNKSGLMGVWLHKPGVWRAEIAVNGRRIYLGLYDTPEGAHKSYKDAKAKYHTFNPKIRNSEKVCNCPSFKFPHRYGSGNCEQQEQEQAKEQQDWDAYYAQRSVPAGQKELHQSGHSASDF